MDTATWSKLKSMSNSEIESEVMGRLTSGYNLPKADASAESPVGSNSASSLEETPEALEARVGGYLQATTDPNTGEFRDKWASGLTPEAAINQSPVDLIDRAKLAVGNTEGKINYLKSKFEDVKPTKSGMLAVKNKGLWYNVDPENLGDGDALSKAKEAFADFAADIWPEAAATAASVGTAIATGGASIPAQLATAGATGAFAGSSKVVLGKLLGTYQASPEDIAKDIALETVINMGGQAVGMFGGYALPKVGAALAKAGSKLKSTPQAVKDTFVYTQSLLTGRPASQISTWINEAEAVGKKLIEVEPKYNPVPKIARERLNDQALKLMPKIARGIEVAQQKFYGDKLDEIVTAVSNEGGIFDPQISNGIRNGLVKLNAFGTWDETTRTLTPKPYKQLISELSESGEFGALDEGGYKLVTKTIDMLNNYTSLAPKTGREGALQLKQFNSEFKKFIFSQKRAAYLENTAGADSLLDAIEETVGNSINFSIANNPRNASFMPKLTELDNAYRVILNKTKPVIRDMQKARGDFMDETNFSTSFETLFKESNLMGSKKIANQNNFEDAITLLSDYNPGLKTLHREMLINRAADGALDTIRGGFMGVGALVSGAAFVNPMLAGVGAVTSPRLASKTARLLSPMLKGNAWMRTLPAAEKQQLFSNPELFNKWLGSMVQAPGVHDSIMEQLSPTQGAPQP